MTNSLYKILTEAARSIEEDRDLMENCITEKYIFDALETFGDSIGEVISPEDAIYSVVF